MARYAAFLRSINVGGNNKVPMADLRAMLAELGFGNPRTLLQSGNVVFEADAMPDAELQNKLESGLFERLGLRTDFVLRNLAQVDRVIAENPFPDEAAADPSHLLVFFSKETCSSSHAEAVQAAVKGREVARAAGDHLYISYPDGMGESKLTINVIEKHLGCRGTARNWNTVRKMQDLLNSP